MACGAEAACPDAEVACGAEAATEAVAGSSAEAGAAGRPRLRLLVASRENPAPAVNSQSTSTTMAILNSFPQARMYPSNLGASTLPNPDKSDGKESWGHRSNAWGHTRS